MFIQILGLICWGGAGFLIWILYTLFRLVIDGMVLQNAWMLIGGGILLFCSLTVLIFFIIGLILVGLALLQG